MPGSSRTSLEKQNNYIFSSLTFAGSPERLADSLREYKITWLGKQDFKSEEAKATFEELKNTEKANQVQIRMARLNCMDFDDKFSLEPTPDQKEKAEAAAEICREVLNLVKVKDVLAHSALKHDARADAADVRKEMERQRGWYVEAACKLGLAQLCLGKPKEEATETLLDLLRMCDPSEPRAAAFVSHHAEAVGHIARALRAAMAQLEAKPGTVELEHRYEGSILAQCVFPNKQTFCFSQDSPLGREDGLGARPQLREEEPGAEVPGQLRAILEKKKSMTKKDLSIWLNLVAGAAQGK